MSTAQDSSGRPAGFGRVRTPRDQGPKVRRLNGDEAVSPGASRRAQADAQILRLVDERVVEQRLLERQQPDMAWNLAGLRIDADGLFAFAMFVPLLFMAQWGPIGAAGFAGLVPLYLYVRRERLGHMLAPRAFLLLPAGFALLSVLWSEAPRESFKTAIELGLTVVAGLLISSARNQGAVIKGLAAAFFLYVLASAVIGGRAAIGVGAGGYALSGLSGSKNLLGDIASAGAIVAIAAIMLGVRRRHWHWVLLGVAAAALCAYVVLASRSAGALLGLGMAATAMISLSLLVLVGPVFRAWLTSAVALCVIAAGFNYRWLVQTLIDTGARMFDKDPTLTGRTYLWYRANDLIVEKPALGRGYEAFWLQGNLDAEGLWRYFGILERGGFTFHNTAVELLVMLGWVGLVLWAVVAIIGMVFLIRRFVLRPSIALVCWISLFLYMVARTPIETIGVAPFYFSTALAFAALGAGFGRVKLPRPMVHYRPGQELLNLRLVDYAAPARTSLRVVRPSEP